MERMLDEITIDGVHYKIGDKIQVRERYKDVMDDFYGLYKLDGITDFNGSIFFSPIPLEGQMETGDKWHWRFKPYKKNNLANY